MPTIYKEYEISLEDFLSREGFKEGEESHIGWDFRKTAIDILKKHLGPSFKVEESDGSSCNECQISLTYKGEYIEPTKETLTDLNYWTIIDIDNAKAITKAMTIAIKEFDKTIIESQVFLISKVIQDMTLKEKIIKALEIPEDNFSNSSNDLMILYSDEVMNWLKANYEFPQNIKVDTSNVKGQSWYGKRFIEIPFAYEEFYKGD